MEERDWLYEIKPKTSLLSLISKRFGVIVIFDAVCQTDVITLYKQTILEGPYGT